MRTLLNLIEAAYIPDQIRSRLDDENRLKRVYFFMGACISIPVIAGFGLSNVFAKGLTHGWVDLMVVAVLSVVIPVLRRSESDLIYYRISLAAVSILFLTNVAFSRTQLLGNDILWLYAYPMVVFFLMGRKEGIVWVVFLIAPISLMIQFRPWPSIYDYSPAFRLRFIFSIVLVSLFAWWFEYLRYWFYNRLKEQKRALVAASREIRTLSGLIPICASCKKIRDDKGYWQAVEKYVSDHTDAQFSHSICDDCLRQSEPELFDRMVKAGELKLTEEKD